MEFKKPNRHNQRRLQLDAPQRRGPTPAKPSPARPPAPAASPATPSQPEAPLKTTAMSHARRFLSVKRSVVIVILAAVICLAVWLFMQNSGGGAHKTAGKPDYQTVLPSGKSIRELGGWKRISPPEKEPVFAYADTVDGVPISVSQQPLPASFKDDAESQVAELAKKFNATNEIDAGTTKLYVGTSAKGPQSAILTKDNVLILIKSQKKISDASWVKYAETLR